VAHASSLRILHSTDFAIWKLGYLRIHQFSHGGDGFFNTSEHGSAQDAVADVEFMEMGDGENFLNVSVVDAVPSVDNEAKGVGEFGSFLKFFEFRLELFREVVEVGEGSCVEFDPWSLDFCRDFDLGRIRVNEEAGVDACFVHGCGNFPDSVDLAEGIEPAFGGDFLSVFRDQADAVGVNLEGELQHLWSAGHFQVEAGSDLFPKVTDVVSLNVAGIFAEVGGDAVGSGFFAEEGQFYRIRLNVGEIFGLKMAIAGLA